MRLYETMLNVPFGPNPSLIPQIHPSPSLIRCVMSNSCKAISLMLWNTAPFLHTSSVDDNVDDGCYYYHL